MPAVYTSQATDVLLVVVMEGVVTAGGRWAKTVPSDANINLLTHSPETRIREHFNGHPSPKSLAAAVAGLHPDYRHAPLLSWELEPLRAWSSGG